MLAGCFPPCNPEPSPGELRFLNQGNVVDMESTISAATFNEVPLAPVPDIPLIGFWSGGVGGVTVDIQSNDSLALVPLSDGLQGRQVEAHLFAVDLTDLNNYFRGTNAGLAVSLWDDRANAGATGRDVILPFPPNAQWNVANRSGGFLLPIHFWPSVAPDVPASDPTGTGSVKSVRVYKGALCSQDAPFTDSVIDGVFVPGFFDTATSRFFVEWNKIAGNGSIRYSRMTALLDDGLDLYGPKGGFYFYFFFEGGGRELPANYEYQLTLTDGQLDVLPTRNDLFSVKPQSDYAFYASLLEQTWPSILRDELFRIVFHRDFLQATPCDTSNDPTKLARDLWAAKAKLEAQKLGYSIADQNVVFGLLDDKAKWECNPLPGGTIQLATFIKRAKRLNVYGDAVELVWFDNIDVNDPMYALYLARRNAFGDQTGNPFRLCGHDRTIVNSSPQFAFRPLVTVSK